MGKTAGHIAVRMPSFMRILIAGAGGLVGQALTRHFRTTSDVVPLSHADLEITSAADVGYAFDQIRPDVIINCAVIGVDECERDPAHAFAVNVRGPRLLARAAREHRAAMIHFSSNYVFDGERTDGGFYTPDDEALPINVYGRTKLDGERAVREECERSWIVRTSWVFGPGKDSFLATAHRKLRGGECLQAIRDVFASTTYVSDLVERVDQLFASGETGVFHVNNDGVCSYADFAGAAANLVGLDEHARAELIQHVSEDEMAREAPRPRWTPMRCSRTEQLGLSPMRPWQEALAAYIEEGE